MIALMVYMLAMELLINGTGFNGYTKVTTIHIISGTNAGTTIRTEEYQPGKALWDWMQLLIVPILLTIGGLWFNQLQKEREQKEAKQRAETEQKEAKQRYENELKIAIDNQRAAFGSRALRAAVDSSPLWGAGRVEDTYNLVGHARRPGHARGG